MKAGIIKRSFFDGQSLAEAARDTRQISDGQARKVFSDVGARNPYPIVEFKDPKFENAMYIGPGQYDWALKRFTQNVGNMTPAKLKKLREIGFIAHGPGFKNPGLMAHEAGHARIEEEGGAPAFFQKHRDGLSALGFGLGVGSAYVLGKHTNPWVGAALGGGLAALGQVPMILNERAATRHATQYMDRSRMTDTEKSKNTNALRKGMNSYLINGALMTALGAGTGALLSEK